LVLLVEAELGEDEAEGLPMLLMLDAGDSGGAPFSPEGVRADAAMVAAGEAAADGVDCCSEVSTLGIEIILATCWFRLITC
jgi:hypothetical protein